MWLTAVCVSLFSCRTKVWWSVRCGKSVRATSWPRTRQEADRCEERLLSESLWTPLCFVCGDNDVCVGMCVFVCLCSRGTSWAQRTLTFTFIWYKDGMHSDTLRLLAFFWVNYMFSSVQKSNSKSQTIKQSLFMVAIFVIINKWQHIMLNIPKIWGLIYRTLAKIDPSQRQCNKRNECTI